MADGLSNPVDVSNLVSMIPLAGADLPASETRAGAIGQAGFYALDGHSHPRLTSVSSGVLDATGMSASMMFTRSFATQPGVVLTAITPGGTQPVVLQVQSWIQEVGGAYVGCTVKGYRTQLLPATIATLLALVSFNIAGGSVAGVAFSLIAIQSS